jgi:hypothetical protein
MKYAFILFTCVISFSCKKIPNTTAECAAVKAAIIISSDSIYSPGDDIHLTISPNNPRPDGYITWYKSGGAGQIGINSSLDIPNCIKGDEGWYIMALDNQDCGISYIDSIYVTVKNAPATAPCSLADNAVTFSSIPDISPASVTYGSDPSYGTKALDAYANPGYPEMHVYFNQYWNGIEQEDGKYSVGNLGDLSANTVYEVTITCLYSGINFTATSGDVYVSHDNNNKLIVKFCSLNMTGYNGTVYTTVASGSLTTP